MCMPRNPSEADSPHTRTFATASKELQKRFPDHSSGVLGHSLKLAVDKGYGSPLTPKLNKAKSINTGININ